MGSTQAIGGMTMRISGYARSGAALGFAALAGLSLNGCSVTTPSSAAVPQTAAAGGAVANPCGSSVTGLSAALTQSSGGTTATSLDCVAWQMFVSLNWRADPKNPGYPDPTATAAMFGNPNDAAPKVWETYKEAQGVFAAGVLKGTWQARRPAVKTLSRVSKMGPVDLSDIIQAGGNHWLTNVRGGLTYYEVMMNRDEYEFITTQKYDLTSARGQLACASQPGKYISDGPPGPPPPGALMRGGLTMPEGSAAGWDDTDCDGNTRNFGDGVGAMELKASWTPLPADHSLDYRYKTAVAMIQDPVTKSMRQVTVGLVGLHIARKRFARHQWIWTTFEHIDNSPDEAKGAPGWAAPALPANPNRKPSPGFTYFNPACNPLTNPFRCTHNAPPLACPPKPGTGPCQPYTAPMQITRLNPVNAAANSVTGFFWSLMPANSVFNYYRLIDVQWPTRPGNPLPAGQRVPPQGLPQGSPMPVGASGGTGQILADTTMESFLQSSASCLDCHAFSSIASPSLSATRGKRELTRAAVAQQPYASDYSFLFATETVKP